jgi:hypothetical protein
MSEAGGLFAMAAALLASTAVVAVLLLRTLRTISESQSAVVRRSDSGFGDSGAG